MEYGSADSNNISRIVKTILPRSDYDELLRLVKKLDTDTKAQHYRSPKDDMPNYDLRIKDNLEKEIIIISRGLQLPEPLQKVYKKLMQIMKRHKWTYESF